MIQKRLVLTSLLINPIKGFESFVNAQIKNGLVPPESFLAPVLVTVSLLWRDTMTKITLIKANICLGLAYSFRGSVHYHHGRKHGSMQAYLVLEKELRILHLGPEAARKRLSHTGVEPEHRRPQSPHFLQQGHTSSNNATPPNSVTPHGQVLRHTNLWGPNLFRPPHHPFCLLR